MNGFSERDWRNLLMDIEARQVIPIVGPELATLDEEIGQPTIYQYVARELAARLSIEPGNLAPGHDLLDVSSLYLQDPRHRAADLYYETREILTERSWASPKPLRQLAAITHFGLFVSTTFDGLLEQALNEVRYPGARRTRTIAYSEKRQIEDLPAEFDNAGTPTVFHLFGKLDATGDYGITEERVLEFSHRIQSRDFRPQNLFDALRTRSLLALGCSLPGWLVRFVLRATKGEQLFTQGAHGLIADLACRGDVALVMFLERRQISVYQGDAVQFVSELHRRWMARFGAEAASGASARPPLSQRPDFKRDSVFISYASDDRQHALRVKRAFDDAGVDAWFDQNELHSGDDFRSKIERSIEDCSYFVPLISRHTATTEKRFFWREWNKAIDEARSYPPSYPFIQPILLDDTPLPHEFGDRQYRRLKDLPLLIEDAKRRIRERRLQRMSA